MRSMRFPSREEVEKVRNEYPKGCRVVLERMDDNHTKTSRYLVRS